MIKCSLQQLTDYTGPCQAGSALFELRQDFGNRRTDEIETHQLGIRPDAKHYPEELVESHTVQLADDVHV